MPTQGNRFDIKRLTGFLVGALVACQLHVGDNGERGES
jgi:hypothetical protein